MYLLGSLIAAFFGYSLWEDISDIPLSDLTLGMIFGDLFAVIFFLAALHCLIGSLEHDRLWPWRWTKRYLLCSVQRIAAAAFLIWGGVYLAEETKNGFVIWTIIIVFGILSLSMFVIEEEEFVGPEKKKDEN